MSYTNSNTAAETNIDSNLYYSAPAGRLMSCLQVKSTTGVKPDLSATGNISLLNQAQIYPLREIPQNPYDYRLYTVDLSYTTANYASGTRLSTGEMGPAGEYATRVYTETALSLAEAKAAGIKAIKESASLTVGDGDGFNAMLLISAASKTASSRSSEVQAALDGITTVLDDLVTDIQAIDSATTVAQIDAIVNP